MTAWDFRDFVNARGENVVHTWLHGIPAAARAEINDLIMLLELRTVDQFSREDSVGLLRRECRGLLELIVKVEKVQYRPVGRYGPGRKVVTLLGGANERDGHLTPPDICKTTLARSLLLESDPERYSCEHDIGQPPRAIH